MVKLLSVVSIVAISAIIFVIIVLLKYNSWSSKLVSPIVSIICVALVSSLITIFFQLKSSGNKETFISSVVVYNETSMPLIFTYSGTDIFLKRNDELGRLASEVKKRFSSKLTGEKISPYLFHDITREAIQYQIIQYISELAGETTEIFKDKLRYRTTYKLKDPGVFKGSNFKDELEKNHIHYYQGMNLNSLINQTYLFPKKTNLKLRNSYYENDQKNRNHTIILENKDYFKIEIIISDFHGHGKGFVPDIMGLDEEMRSKCSTKNYKITINSKFENLTSLSTEQEDYIKWTKWLVEELKSRFGDHLDSRLQA